MKLSVFFEICEKYKINIKPSQHTSIIVSTDNSLTFDSKSYFGFYLIVRKFPWSIPKYFIDNDVQRLLSKVDLDYCKNAFQKTLYVPFTPKMFVAVASQFILSPKHVHQSYNLNYEKNAMFDNRIVALSSYDNTNKSFSFKSFTPKNLNILKLKPLIKDNEIPDNTYITFYYNNRKPSYKTYYQTFKNLNDALKISCKRKLEDIHVEAFIGVYKVDLTSTKIKKNKVKRICFYTLFNSDRAYNYSSRHTNTIGRGSEYISITNKNKELFVIDYAPTSCIPIGHSLFHEAN